MTIGLLIVILVVGVVMALLPMDAQVKRLVYVGLVVLFLVWLLMVFGVIGDGGFRTGRVIIRD